MGYYRWCLRSEYCYAYFGDKCGCRDPYSFEIPSSCPHVHVYNTEMPEEMPEGFTPELDLVTVKEAPQKGFWSPVSMTMAAMVGALTGAGAVSVLRRKKDSKVLLDNDYQQDQS
jgi:hypothetical protein